MTSVLRLGKSTSTRLVPGRRRSTKRRETLVFDDWIIDGVALRDLLKPASFPGRHPTVVNGHADISYLVEGSDQALRQIDRLLGRLPADFDQGRVALLICAFDWAVECGALTAELRIGDSTVQWRNLGWQDACDAAVEYVHPALSIVFDRPSYEQVLIDARDRYLRPPGAESNRPSGASWS